MAGVYSFLQQMLNRSLYYCKSIITVGLGDIGRFAPYASISVLQSPADFSKLDFLSGLICNKGYRLFTTEEIDNDSN